MKKLQRVKCTIFSVLMVISFFSSVMPTVNATSDDGWLWPVPNNKTVFSPYRHPNRPKHYGIDISKNSSKYEVVATRSGTVKAQICGCNSKCSHNGGYGNLIIINHGDGYTSIYGHLTPDVVVNKGMVKQGDVIGYTGKSGKTDATHLHFEIKYNGTNTNVNPYDNTYIKSNNKNQYTDKDICYAYNGQPGISYKINGSTKVPGTNNGITKMTATYYAANDNVPVRAAPYATDTILERLSKGTAVSVTGSGKNSVGNLWYKIERNGLPFWIFSDNLTPTNPNKTTLPEPPVTPLGTEVTSSYANQTIAIKSVANSKYLSSGINVSGIPVRAVSDAVGSWERFETNINSDGWISFKNVKNGKFMAANPNTGAVTVTSDEARSWEHFKIYNYNGNLFILARSSNKWLSTQVSQTLSPVIATATEQRGWEQFSIDASSSGQEDNPTYGTATIQYNMNGGSGSIPAQIIVVDKDGTASFKLTTTKPTRSGYDFLGWRLENDTAYDIDSPGQSIAIGVGNATTILTYYAQWKAVASTAGTLTVIYDANGGSGTPANQTVSITKSGYALIKLPSVVPTRNGYTFLGWKLDGYSGTKMDEITVQYTDNSQNQTVTLYAQWQENITSTTTQKTDVPSNYRPKLSGSGSTSSTATLSITIKYDASYPITELGFVVTNESGTVTYYNASFTTIPDSGSYQYKIYNVPVGSYFPTGYVIIDGKRYDSYPLQLQIWP